jgi:hypothetical protein
VRKHLQSRGARRGVAALAVLALAAGIAMAMPAGARPSAADRPAAPTREGPKAVAHHAGSRSAATAAAPSAAAANATGLTYSTVDACRTFDSRQVGGPFGFGDGFFIKLTGDCGVPDDGSVKAVMANVISVNATGTGALKAAPFEPTHTAPAATVLNFNKNLVSSNAIPLSVCDRTATTCDFDIDIFIPSAAASNIVLDVVGYFS